MNVGSPTGNEQVVAVIGIGCRFPGAIGTPEAYWDLLESGGIIKSLGQGSYLDHPGDFDAAFFGVPPREAELMDPRQRIMLETAWEALEHACTPPDSLAGTDTGVFIGVNSADYGTHPLADLPRSQQRTGAGSPGSAVADGLSGMLGLKGPNRTVDAAYASPLLPVHLAGAALRHREADLALAGGVNVIVGPALTRALDAARLLSPAGRSRPFDAAADGYVRAEGAGVLVLKRLADAERDQDRIFAVIAASAVQHGAVRDGGTPNGITAPGRQAQESVVRAALRQAGTASASIGYVEAHGTATRAADAVEIAVLSQLYGRHRPATQPLLIGSVKGNIGHQEAAAGIAGIIKAVLALGQGRIPPQAGFAIPNPDIAWAGAGIEVAAAGRGWPVADGPRRAAVSSFGYGGGAGHLILEQAPAPARPIRRSPAPAPPGLALFPVSGASEAATRASAGQLAALPDPPAGPSVTDIHHSLWHGRTHQRFRAAVIAADRESLRAGLRKIAAGEAAVTRALPAAQASPAWLFSGHGSQWGGMGRQLLAVSPAFADVIAEIEPVYLAEAGWPVAELLRAGRFETTDQIQAMIFAVQVGLARMLEEAGMRPGAVVGHSVGEVAAAVVAGVLSLADGARLICRRSILLRRAAGAGSMLLVRMGFDEVREALAGRSGAAAAIESSTGSTVVAGSPAVISRFAAECRQADIAVLAVASDVAFHTAQMNPLAADLERALAGIEVAAPVIPLYTTALADPRSQAPRDASYWAANLRNPVRLATAVKAMAADGYRIFLELSPHPVVTFSVRETLTAAGVPEPLVTGTLLKNKPELETLTASLERLYRGGVALQPGRQAPHGAKCTLPRTVWQHQRFWHLGGDPLTDHPPARSLPVTEEFRDHRENRCD